MRQIIRTCIRAGMTLTLLACAGGAPNRNVGATTGVGPNAGSRRSDLLSYEEIQGQHWLNAYDLVSALRANWFNPRGPDSFRETPEVAVVYNGVRAGGPDFLRTVAVDDVAFMQYFDPISASARFGLGYGHGAIYVSTHPQ